MPSNITSFAEFRLRLNDVLARIDQLAATGRDPVIQAIQRQLRSVEQWTQSGRRPAQADLDELSFGRMASRDVADRNPQLATDLYELASFLIFWPASQSA